MTELEQSATCYRLRNEFFEFSYQFVADRWQHSVSVRQGNDWRPVLTSLEGQPADSFLSSPAFQDLRFEQPAANIFEFQLLGQSGKGVYSGAVRLDALGRTCDFDLCARGRTAASPLCSCTTYRLAAPDVVPVIR